MQQTAISLTAGTASTIISHPFEFLKTKIQVYNEGIGFRGKRLTAGYNMYKVFKDFHEVGYGSSVLFTGFYYKIKRITYVKVIFPSCKKYFL